MDQFESTNVERAAPPEFVAGGGEMGERIRKFDWSPTSLGDLTSWPQSLRTCVRIMLTSRQPIWIGWGPELLKLYNDPYKAIVGGKHPWALGQPVSAVWRDIWRDIEPLLRSVTEEDTGIYVESQLLIMERNGYPEETYYTFSYTPIPGDDGKTAGVFCANTDDTDRIISARQLRTLTSLGKQLGDSQSDEDVIRKTLETLRENKYDFPYAVFRQKKGEMLIYADSTSPQSFYGVPAEIALSDSSAYAKAVEASFSSREAQIIDIPEEDQASLPNGAWEIAPHQKILLPIFLSANSQPFGILEVGLNPYRVVDDKYASFFSLITDQISTSLGDVHALEEERKRAAALAEIDRAKTTFFSNISHEFRTPLTLLLGPIQDALQDADTLPENRQRMEVAFRNALRMQKLVNTLLDFSRIEAGKLKGQFTRADISAVTRQLAGSFEAAIGRAGMKYVVNIPTIEQPVYVDLDMWEKVVLNLISNAFKYCKAGSIVVSLREAVGSVTLTVSDTGIGIPGEHLTKIFDRFHRVENGDARSQEGTGIGLAMVKELVRFHHGNIEVKSEPSKGSEFSVTIPTGKDHLKDELIVDADDNRTSGSNLFVHEAEKWVADLNAIDHLTESRPADNAPTVLVADDNTDMRSYIARLLQANFHVIEAIDGEDAYRKILEYRPDLVISDVMMPRLNGFGLLGRIRANAGLKRLPLIFLSARAGEEAKVEGLDAGADDYLVKPFAARELIARVEANIRIARSREAGERNMQNMIRQAPVAMAVLRGRDFVIETANELALEIWGRSHSEVINRPLFEALPEIEAQGFRSMLEGVYTTGETFYGTELPITLHRFGAPATLFLNFIYEPFYNEKEEIDGVLAVGMDVTQQVLARRTVEESGRQLQTMADAMPQLVWVADDAGQITYFNSRLAEFTAPVKSDAGTYQWKGLVHEEDLSETQKRWEESVSSGRTFQFEHRIRLANGDWRWHLTRAVAQKGEDQRPVKWFGTTTDVHASREQADVLEQEVRNRTSELHRLNAQLKQSNDDLMQFAHVASHDLKEPVRKVKTFTSRLLSDFGSLLPEKGISYVSKIEHASERMNAMIEGVLNYSTLSSSGQSIVAVNLNEVMSNVEADLEVFLQQKQGIVRVNNMLPTIEGAPVLIHQLFYNLVNNSLKFSRIGVPPVITISSTSVSESDSTVVEIRLQDNGIGFENEYAERIFETFARLNSKDLYEGSGIGLALCKKIVERHHGTIHATGDAGNGAEFIVRLPLTQKKGNQ